MRFPGLIALLLFVLVLAAPAVGQEPAERDYLFALKAYRDGLYDVSVEGFREYLTSAPKGAHQIEANFFLGQALLRLGRDEEGLSALEAAAKADSSGRVAPLARHIRVRRYLDLARYKEADAEADRWLRYFPRHKLRWEVELLKGRALVGLERLDEAASLFSRVAGSKKVSTETAARALSRLAAVRAALGKDEEEAAAWSELVARAPENPLAARARLRLAARAWEAGRFEEALDQSEALLKSFPEAAEAGPAKLLRADSLFGLGRWLESWKAYAEAAEGEGENAFSEAHWERTGLAAYRAERFQEAARALAKAGDGPGGSNLAVRFQAHRKAGETARALKVASRLLAEYPSGRWAAGVVGPAFELARSSRQWEGLHEGLSAYLRGAPPARRLEARYMLAHVKLAVGRPGEAQRLFGDVASAEGGLDRYRDVRYKRALALSASGSHRKALGLLEALSADERAAVSEKAVLSLEADIHRALEHYKASADRLRALLAQWPEDPEAGRWLLTLAEMEEARGRVDEALGAYQRWLADHAGEDAAPLVRLTVARLQLAAGRADEAWKSLEELKAAESPEMASQASLLRGRIALERRDYEAALEANSEALEGFPSDSPAYALARWRMAKALEGSGRAEEAAAHYEWLAKNAKDSRVREVSEESFERLAAEMKEREKKTP